jgi:hypothetical protein
METRETITLDARSIRRFEVLADVMEGAITRGQAAGLLGLSERQVQRLLAGLRGERGVTTLVHGNRGRVPANRIDDGRRARLRALLADELTGFNASHVADLLAEEVPELAVSAKTVGRLMVEAGITPPRTRRTRTASHGRRERMPREGMLLQADGSRHDWLEGRGPWLTLVGAVDDATGDVVGATFRDQEDASGYLLVLDAVIRARGIPLGFYTDRHSIFEATRGRIPVLEEQLTELVPRTHVGRALDELGIAWIPAGSPQAKGRVEREWGTLQDRLVSELRRARTATCDDANALLARFLPRHNARFRVPPRIDGPAWRPWTGAWPLGSVLSFHYPRRVAADGTLEWDGASLRVPRVDGGGRGRRWVTLEEHLDGSLWARDGSAHVRLVEAPASAPVLRSRHIRRGPAPQGDPWRPGPDHPWRGRYRGTDTTG